MVVFLRYMVNFLPDTQKTAQRYKKVLTYANFLASFNKKSDLVV